MVPSIEAKASPTMTHDRRGRFDFHVIDSVYGRNSDLYCDVLGISPDATRKEIRAAFVDLRDEFFQFQSQVENGNVVVTEGQLEFSKRRMDAVVAAFRILHDPDLRAFYDEARYKRSERSSKLVVQDSKDPVEQAVHRALEKSPTRRASPATRRTSMGRSPLQSSSGASTTDDSSDGEGGYANSPKKRTYRGRPSMPDRNCGENRNTHAPKKRTSREKPFQSPSGASTPLPGSCDERRNTHSANKRSFRGKSSKRTESPANYYIMDEQTTPRRQQQVYSTSPSWSLFDGDSDSVSVHSQDIGASRNYFTEKKSPRQDSISTIATADEDVTPDDDDNSYHDGSNTLLEYEPTDQTGDLSVADTSVADSTVLSVVSYTYEDETTVGEEDLGDLCCSSERRVSKNRGFIAKTHAIVRAVKSEIKGSINDTITAVDQVLNAFTLQENDIQAVTSRIDKVSKQLAG